MAAHDIEALVGRPVKYYSRMTPETRGCLIAAAIAAQGSKWTTDDGKREIGLLAAGDDGSLHANERYFRDYVVNGRSMGRGNFFIYTLPTSTLGEVAIALALRGPSLYLHDAAQPLATLVQHAGHLIEDGEAEGILALWSDAHAAVCLSIDGRSSDGKYDFLFDDPHPSPLQLANRLRFAVVPS